ncbi:outer membrane protein TolC [Rhodovulum adriaticum]|uniref:Outer membrane protein TolC n=2 Tax=Rhodovulum adriaticum TaxID=35804 RepID=A0A4R2NFH1_RHOAD|nr:outer membrane protein TolC [Rhodovulum adriaticum]
MAQEVSDTLTETTMPDAEANIAPVDIAMGFGPALKSAVEANDAYRALLALETAAVERIGVASSVRHPQITANANVGALRETGGIADDTTTGIAGGLTISQLVYDGGTSRAEVNGATAEALAARAERVAQGNALALEAARAWIDAWQFDARLRLLHSRTDEMNRLMAQIERMASNGMIDRGALESARRQIIDIALEQTRLEADLNEARVRYARFFNRPVGQLARPADLVSSTEVRKAAKDWQQSPQLQRAAAELLVSQAALAKATSAFRPSARLQAGVTSPMEQEESTDLSVGLVLEYTFSDGGRRRSELDSAQARHAAAEAQLSDAQRALNAEIEASLDQLDAIEKSMPLVARQITLSASEAKTARSQIATGQANLRQLVEAEIENYRARDRHIALQAERQILLMTIESRTGRLAQRIGLSIGPVR